MHLYFLILTVSLVIKGSNKLTQSRCGCFSGCLYFLKHGTLTDRQCTRSPTLRGVGEADVRMAAIQCLKSYYRVFLLRVALDAVMESKQHISQLRRDVLVVGGLDFQPLGAQVRPRIFEL